jgi:hypothetical protein
LISEGEAKRKDLSLGDHFDVRIDGQVRPLIVQGIYASADFIRRVPITATPSTARAFRTLRGSCR